MENFNLASAMAWRVPDITGIKAVFLGDHRDTGEEYELDDLLRGKAEALGKGTIGTTYKVKLKNQKNVVVKRLWTNNKIAEKELKDKIEELGKIVHQNLLTIRAYSCIIAERVLVYDYMSMGSLAFFLHETKDGTSTSPLTWEMRCSIAYGVASALQHIHTIGSKICHGNIRSSNVFLSDFHNAHLTEYSLYQLESHRSKLKLPEGYRAPEVTTLQEVSHKSDVYSFGVLLLELLAGKPPIGAIRSTSSGSSGVDLPKWVRGMFIERPIIDVFDDVLVSSDEKINGIGEEMVDMLQLAICCTFEIPSKRPTMDAVVNRIRQLVRRFSSSSEEPYSN